VKINNRATATKGSKSRNNAPMHLPMPPGVQFKKPPNNEGEVTSGTIPNVKVNGKEVAVLGSKVTTCNDPMPQETCSIIAIGIAPKLPIEIPVTNPIDRHVINPRWDKAKATIGEKVKLQVELINQFEYITVEYKIYPEGADTKKDQPIQKLYGRNIESKSEVEWEYKYIKDPNKPLTKKPKFKFTAESFGCGKVESGAIEIYADYTVEVRDIMGNLIVNTDCEVVTADGSKRNTKTDSNAILELKDVIPGDFEVIPKLKDEKGNPEKMYAGYRVKEGDTLKGIIEDFLNGNLIKFENKIVAAEGITEDSVWGDEKNKEDGAICFERYEDKEGKNLDEKKIYDGETVYLPCKSIIICV